MTQIPSKHYILVTAPMDQSYIGPFLSHEAASGFAAFVASRFPAYDYGSPVTAADLQAEVARFGVINVQAPITFLMEMERAEDLETAASEAAFERLLSGDVGPLTLEEQQRRAIPFKR